MTTSTSEAILKALHAAIDTTFGGEATRNEPLPSSIPKNGLAILWDGEPGEPEVTLSPLTYHYTHAAELLVFVDGGTPEWRNRQFDARKQEIAAALAVDRTLGGLCDWVEAGAPSTEDLPVIGAKTIKSALIPIFLTYATSDPLT